MKLFYILPILLGLCACEEKPIYTLKQAVCNDEKVGIEIHKDYAVVISEDTKHHLDLKRQFFYEDDEVPAMNVYGDDLAIYTNSSQTGIDVFYNNAECYFDSFDSLTVDDKKYKVLSKTKRIDEKVIQKIFALQSIDVVDSMFDGKEALSNDGSFCWKVPSGSVNPQMDKMQSCEDAGLTKTGEWAVRFPYGTVKGESKCGSLSWDEYEKMKSNTDTYVQALNTEGDCWCKANGLYKSMTDKTTKIMFDKSDWVLRGNFKCNMCPIFCSGKVMYDSDFRFMSFFTDRALYHAAERGNLETVQELVNQGYDVNYVCTNPCKGWTPVMIAAAEGHLDVVKFLLDKGANPNAQNRYGRTAISFAINYKFKPIVEALLNHGADPTIISRDTDKPNSGMAGALIKSISNSDSYEILKMLVHRTGNVNFEFWGYTPLMMAVVYDDYDFTKYLLENGADVNHTKTVKQEDGTVIEYKIKGKSEELQNLIDSYAGKDTTNDTGDTDTKKDTPKLQLKPDGITVATVLNMDNSCYAYENGAWAKNEDNNKCSWLSAGHWEVIFEDGKIFGTSRCATNTNKSDFLNGDMGQYCWCGYSVITSNIKKPATEWEFVDDLNSATECETGCALRCVKDMPESIDSLRISLFGALEDMTGVLTKGMKGMVDGMEAVMKDTEDK